MSEIQLKFLSRLSDFILILNLSDLGCISLWPDGATFMVHRGELDLLGRVKLSFRDFDFFLNSWVTQRPTYHPALFFGGGDHHITTRYVPVTFFGSEAKLYSPNCDLGKSVLTMLWFGLFSKLLVSWAGILSSI